MSAPPRRCNTCLTSLQRSAPGAPLLKNYDRPQIDPGLPFSDQLLELARHCRARLTRLIADWKRVGSYQGSFNSDSCAAQAYTLE